MTTTNYKYQSDIGMKFLKANLLLLGLLGCNLGIADQVTDQTTVISDIVPDDTNVDPIVMPTDQTQPDNSAQTSTNTVVVQDTHHKKVVTIQEDPNIPMVPALVNKNGYYYTNPPVRFQNYVDTVQQVDPSFIPGDPNSVIPPFALPTFDLNGYDIPTQATDTITDVQSTDPVFDQPPTEQSPADQPPADQQPTDQKPTDLANPDALNLLAKALAAVTATEPATTSNDGNDQQKQDGVDRTAKIAQTAPRTGGSITVQGANLIQIISYVKQEPADGSTQTIPQTLPTTPTQEDKQGGWNIRSENWEGHD